MEIQKVINRQEEKINKIFDILKSVTFDYELQKDLKELNDKINKLDNICVEQYDLLFAKVEDNFKSVTEDLGYEANQRTKVHNRLCKVEKKLNDKIEELDAISELKKGDSNNE